MQNNTRSMGLDVGSRTIGVAVSDLMGWTAQGITTIRRTSLERDLVELEKIIAEQNVDKIIIGMPFNMNGTEGASAEAARALGNVLIERCAKEIIYQDERLTTVSAQRVLLEGNVSRKKRREVVDKVAAVFILQTYLDSNK